MRSTCRRSAARRPRGRGHPPRVKVVGAAPTAAPVASQSDLDDVRLVVVLRRVVVRGGEEVVSMAGDIDRGHLRAVAVRTYLERAQAPPVVLTGARIQVEGVGAGL